LLFPGFSQNINKTIYSFANTKCFRKQEAKATLSIVRRLTKQFYLYWVLRVKTVKLNGLAFLLRRICFCLEKFWAKAYKITEKNLEKDIGIPKT
jgi:hypothetical protein